MNYLKKKNEMESYTKVPNNILEIMMTDKLTHLESRVLAVVLRKTFGFGKKWDKISLSQFQAQTGLDRRNLSKALDTLVLKHILGKNAGNAKTPSSWTILDNSFNELASVKKYTSVNSVTTKSTPTKEREQNKEKILDKNPKLRDRDFARKAFDMLLKETGGK